MFADLCLSQRLERAEAQANIDFVEARAATFPNSDAQWHEIGGAFAMFEPGQQSRLYADIILPEGRIHFAGEHTSLAHAWIQGSIESGLRAASEINEIGE